MVGTALKVNKSITVSASPERAFEVFASRTSDWWPREHHLGKTSDFATILEPRPGGRWFERQSDGAEFEIGKIIAWDPPKRIVITWELDEEFQHNPAVASEVEVTFTPVAVNSTRVDIEHRNFDSLGERAARMRNMFDADNAWVHVLREFAKQVEAAEHQ